MSLSHLVAKFAFVAGHAANPARAKSKVADGVRRCYIIAMNITIELPPDLESRVRVIPDLDRRVVDFLRNQADLEDWRSRRYSPEAQAIVAEAMAEGGRLGAQGMSREQAFRELRETREEIGRHL